MNKKTIFTIGHSTRSIEEFLEILKQYKIEELIDVRAIPMSKHNPQFNHEDLSGSLKNHHIGYRHQKELGGLRHAHKDSINTGWQNSSFRGFADYMQREEFKNVLKKLIEIAKEKTVVIMCAEAVPWRCHRSLIGDALLIHDFEVIDIYSKTNSKPHKLTSFAKVEKSNIIYPEE